MSAPQTNAERAYYAVLSVLVMALLLGAVSCPALFAYKVWNERRMELTYERQAAALEGIRAALERRP